MGTYLPKRKKNDILVFALHMNQVIKLKIDKNMTIEESISFIKPTNPYI